MLSFQHWACNSLNFVFSQRITPEIREEHTQARGSSYKYIEHKTLKHKDL